MRQTVGSRAVFATLLCLVGRDLCVQCLCLFVDEDTTLSLAELVAHGVGISSEWSGTGNGRIDLKNEANIMFYSGTCKKVFTTACARKGHIPYRGACVGRRVIRNGDKLKEHCTRFEPNCRYHNWIPKGPIKDWLILDCRHSRPKRSTV
jgi:hypothetical protein